MVKKPNDNAFTRLIVRFNIYFLTSLGRFFVFLCYIYVKINKLAIVIPCFLSHIFFVKLFFLVSQTSPIIFIK